MPVAKCGVQFSWDTPIWCKGDNSKKECIECPLNKIYYNDIDIEKLELN